MVSSLLFFFFFEKVLLLSLGICCVMKFIHLTKKNKIEKNDLRNSQEATSQLIQKKKKMIFLGKILNLVLFIRCFKYLLCNEIYI